MTGETFSSSASMYMVMEEAKLLQRETKKANYEKAIVEWENEMLQKESDTVVGQDQYQSSDDRHVARTYPVIGFHAQKIYQRKCVKKT